MLKNKVYQPAYGPKHRMVTTFSDMSAYSVIGQMDTTTAQSSASGHEFHVYVPIIIEEPCTATALVYITGASPAGSVDLGIYNSSGTRLVSLGGLQAIGGASSTIITSIADTPLARGKYYLAAALKTVGGIAYHAPSHWKLSSLTGLYTNSFGVGATTALPSSVDFSTSSKQLAYIPIIAAKVI